MDYKSVIGEEVINQAGKTGFITEVDEKGFIHISYEGEPREGIYMFDPFINGNVKFIKTELQEEIDYEIKHANDYLIELRKKSITTSASKEKFYITRKNPLNEDEVVCRLNCSKKVAFQIFSLFVIEEKAEFEKNGKKRWRQLKMFDSKSGMQIAQES